MSANSSSILADSRTGEVEILVGVPDCSVRVGMEMEGRLTAGGLDTGQLPGMPEVTAIKDSSRD